MSVSPANARPTASRRPVPDGRWLSLGPASRLVGVDPDTLRRWANEGRVEVFVTPGRHRRFDRRALERLATGSTATTPSLSSLGASPARLARVYRRDYSSHAIARRAAADHAGDRERYRQEGRRLVEALVAYLDTDRADDDARRAVESEATALVEAFAGRLRTSDLQLADAITLFVSARRPFLAELARLGHRRALDAARLGQLYAEATGLLDRLLLRLVDAYREEAR